MTSAEPDRVGAAGAGREIEVGGAVRRVVIITVARGPWACYLARQLRPAGASIALVSQPRFKVDPDTLEIVTPRGVVPPAGRGTPG